MSRQEFYDNFLVPEIASKPSSLANLEFPRHFVRHMPPCSAGLQNFEYRDRATNAPAKLLVFGEVRPDSKLSAVGNHYQGRKDEGVIKVKDGSRVRDTLSLGPPKDATKPLRRLYDNQFATFNGLYCLDMEHDNARNVRTSSILECSEVEPTMDGEEEINKAKIVLMFKFSKAAAAEAKTTVTSARVTTKKALNDDADGDASASGPPEDEPSSSTPPSVELGKLYEPSLMPDYDPDHFALVQDKLVQHDIRGIDGELIPAWDNMRRLAPGTIVGVVATLHAFNIYNAPNVYKRIYHLRAHSVYVLYEADGDIDPNEPLRASPSPSAEIFNAANDFNALVDKRKALTRTRDENEVASASHSASNSSRQHPTASASAPQQTSTSASSHASASENVDVIMENENNHADDPEDGERHVSAKAKGKRKAS